MIPPNITPETATVIAALPYTQTLNVDDAPQAFVFLPSCEGQAYRAVWYVFTAGAGDTLIAIYANQGAGPVTNYEPVVSIWTGIPPALTQYSIGSQNFCADLAGNFAMQVPVTPGNTYYIQVVDHFGAFPAPDPAILAFAVQPAPQLAAPAGCVVVTDVVGAFPAAVMAPDGTFVRFAPVTGSEFGSILPSGEWCLGADDDVDITSPTVHFYDINLALVLVYALPTDYSVIQITSNWSDRFYVASYSTVDAMIPPTVSAFSPVGVLLQTWTLPLSARSLSTFFVSRDDTVLYYALPTFGGGSPIEAYDLVNDAPLPSWVAGIPNRYWRNGAAVADGTFWVLEGGTNAVLLTTATLRHYSALGVFLGSVAAPSVRTHLMSLSSDQVSIWLWGHASAVATIAQMRRVVLADGSVGDSFDVPVHNTAGDQKSTETWSISFSCPLLVLQQALPPPTPPPPTSVPIRLSQLPLCVAYDYAVLSPYVIGTGLAWRTPPPSET